MSESPFRYVHLTSGVREAELLPDHLEEAIDDLPRHPDALDPEADRDLVVAMGSELVEDGRDVLPRWAGPDARYLIVTDVPEPAVLRFPTILRIHKPDRRIHISRDREVVKRLVIALLRDHPWEGIVDAYALASSLVVVLGDLSFREFPRDRLPVVGESADPEFHRFEIHTSGSYLYWPDADVHMGPSQMLQAVDPEYLAEVEVQRYAIDRVSVALRQMREERGLTQGEIGDLSERHVRRLENEEFRLTVQAAEEYADAFGLTLHGFLEELGAEIGGHRDGAASAAATRMPALGRGGVGRSAGGSA